MSNFFTDNPDLLFTVKNIGLEKVLELKEHNYTE